MFVVFDLDGTLADIRHRVHLVRGTKPNWDAFFAACVHDVPNWPVVASLKAHLQAGHRVEIWSARSDQVRRETEEWLACDAGVAPMLMTHMRASGDNTPDVALKRYWLAQLHEVNRPDLVYDDRQRVVDMWRAEGITCFQVAPNWEAAERIIAPTEDPLLTVMVGPSGAGKSRWCAGWEHVISSDALRYEFTGRIQDQSRNEDVFVALHRIARARLASGLPVIIDATNLRRRDRLACASLAPPWANVRYVVVDRPLDVKIRDGGWRNDVILPNGKTLVVAHHERMQSILPEALRGDGLPNVTVVDARTSKDIAPRQAA
ncbi:AAA domain-containing protein [Hyphomicrobiales bacterium]|nr:AAA domain-containing protein [Hyphomicrobiales bacterium]CAH1669451.1 conserved hypothetical protein [Hyphomicrobiales bacterium]